MLPWSRAAKEAVQRFLFSSSCSLYGAGGDGFLDENAAFHPVTPYGESKVRVEQEASKLADDHFSPVYLRNATAYGVSRRLRADIVVNNLVGHAVTTGKVLLQSDGSPWRPLVHIRDIIQAFEAALEAPRAKIHDQAFNVGRTSENFQIRDIANLVAEIVPDCKVAFAEGASADARGLHRVIFGKIERGFGLRPSWTLRRGSKSSYAIAEEDDERGVLGPRYYRLRTVWHPAGRRENWTSNCVERARRLIEVQGRRNL
jgi:nucleoside-diphosphate-sugar epimerase